VAQLGSAQRSGR